MSSDPSIMKTDQQSHFLPHKRYPHATRMEKEEYNKQTANIKDSNQTVSIARIFKVNRTCQSQLLFIRHLHH